MINTTELMRLRQDVIQKLLYDIRQELEAEGAIYTETMTDSDLLKTDSQSLTQLIITTDIGQELVDGKYRKMFEEFAKNTKRNRRLK